MKWFLRKWPLLLLILMNAFFVGMAVFLGVASVSQNGWSGLFCPFCWLFWVLLCNLHGLSGMPRRQYTYLVANYGLSKDYGRHFQPHRYYRVVRTHGWRGVKLEVDEAIDTPDAEIVAITVGSEREHDPWFKNGVYPKAGQTIPCFFEWQDVWYSGWLQT